MLQVGIRASHAQLGEDGVAFQPVPPPFFLLSPTQWLTNGLQGALPAVLRPHSVSKHLLPLLCTRESLGY